MKKIIQLIAVCAVLALLALPAFAHTTIQDPCTPEAKTAMYNEIRTLLQSDQAKAYELAKKWLGCPQVAGEEQIATYLKGFVGKWEKASRPAQVNDLVYVKKDYPKAFELGKAILADEPENLKTLIDLAYAGYASKSPAYSADTLAYAQKAIQLIESGKTLPNWSPYKTQDEALGYLYNAIGSLTLPKDINQGLPVLIKAAQFEGNIKKLPTTYAIIAGAYNDGPLTKLVADYESMYKGKDETPESKLAVENINQVMDRRIDALARAVALAGNDPAQAANKKAWMETLSQWYTDRNKSATGLNELIAGVLSKPLPPAPTPITTPTPAATPGASTTTGTSTVTAPVTKPPVTTTTMPATTPATQPAAAGTKPVVTPKPAAAKPKPKRNHKRS
ncbi:MAG: hypothetical protein ABJB97_03170 [Acidobacteriota bacterium]